MIRNHAIHTAIQYSIAFVWLINGLLCKVLGLVPRHQEIVAGILGNNYAPIITKTIGIFEIMMAVWILTRSRPRICALMQMLIVATMNVIEFFTVPHLLLFGKLNSMFALLFILVIYFDEFVFLKKNQFICSVK